MAPHLVPGTAFSGQTFDLVIVRNKNNLCISLCIVCLL